MLLSNQTNFALPSISKHFLLDLFIGHPSVISGSRNKNLFLDGEGKATQAPKLSTKYYNLICLYIFKR